MYLGLQVFDEAATDPWVPEHGDCGDQPERTRSRAPPSIRVVSTTVRVLRIAAGMSRIASLYV